MQSADTPQIPNPRLSWVEAIIVVAIQSIVPALLDWGLHFAPDSIQLAPLCCAALLPYLVAPQRRACHLLSRLAYLTFISLCVFDLVSLGIHFGDPSLLLRYTLAVSPTLLFGHFVFRRPI